VTLRAFWAPVDSICQSTEPIPARIAYIQNVLLVQNPYNSLAMAELAALKAAIGSS
jgi:hypothetical protein